MEPARGGVASTASAFNPIHVGGNRMDADEDLPFLVHFDPAGFQPHTAFAAQDATDRRRMPAALPAIVVFVFVVALLTLFCGE